MAHLLPKLTAGIAASGTFVILFFILYSRGVPPIDSFIVVLLGAGFMALLGYQLGKVLATAQPTPLPPVKLRTPEASNHEADLLADPLLGDDSDDELLAIEDDPLTHPKA
jgi:hypothetical protein